MSLSQKIKASVKNAVKFINDFENKVQENDLTHVEEVLELHDLSRDPQAGTKEAFKIRCQKNFEN